MAGDSMCWPHFTMKLNKWAFTYVLLNKIKNIYNLQWSFGKYFEVEEKNLNAKNKVNGLLIKP